MNLIDELCEAIPGMEPSMAELTALYLAGRVMPSERVLRFSAKRRRALELWERGGVTTGQIAERFGISHRTAKKWINGR